MVIHANQSFKFPCYNNCESACVVVVVNILPPPQSNAVKDLQSSIEWYIERNIGKQKSHFSTNVVEFILNCSFERDLNSAFKEPAREALLKPVLRRALKKDWSIYPKEVSIAAYPYVTTPVLVHGPHTSRRS